MRSKLLIFMSGAICVLPVQTSLAGDLHVDAGVTSDYVWRGLSQTSGGPAVSGGLEYVTDSDWYMGTWVSNTTRGANGVNSAEVDYYIGTSGKGSSVGYDIGLINYTYPQSSDLDFSELYFAFMAEGLTFKWSDSADEGTYLEGSITQKLAFRKNTSVTAHAGTYSRKSGTSYVDTSISLRIEDFSITFSKADVNTAQDKDLKTYISWSYSF